MLPGLNHPWNSHKDQMPPPNPMVTDQTPPPSISTMATIQTLLTLTTLGLDSVPAVVAAINGQEINNVARRLLAKQQIEDPIGHCYTPCELARVGWWYLTQPFTEAQIQRFMDSEGNIAEEYLVAGKFTTTMVGLEAAMSQFSNKAIKETTQTDKNGGQTVLLAEPLEVKNHRRIHKAHKEQFAKCILAAVKLKFGVPKKTQANYLAIQRYAAELIKHMQVRPTDAARVLPYIVQAAFLPSEDEINAARWAKSTLAKERLAEWHHMPTA